MIKLVKFMAITSCVPVEFSAPHHPGLATNGTDFDYILELSSSMESPDAEIVTVLELSDDRRIIEWVGRRWPTFELPRTTTHDENYCRVRVEGTKTVLRAMELSVAQYSVEWLKIKYGSMIE